MRFSDGHVLTCRASECSYNCDLMCCAPEIVIGDDHPACDMFTMEVKNRAKNSPKVQQCLVSDCHFYKQRTCTAAGITLIPHSDHADCATYRT